MNGSKILLVEDEPHLLFQLKLNLESESYEVVSAENGLQAEQLFIDKGPFDLVILDIMLPEKNGLEVAQFIRSRDPRLGILMLTALAGDDDRVKGLETGADDYVTKPFSLKEFLLRVKRMVERSRMLRGEILASEHAEDSLSFGDSKLFLSQGILQTPEGKHPLTKLEANMLAELIRQRGQVVSREFLLQKVWGVSSKVETRTVDNFIMRLRRLVESDPQNPRVIVSVRGLGYRFEH